MGSGQSVIQRARYGQLLSHLSCGPPGAEGAERPERGVGKRGAELGKQRGCGRVLESRGRGMPRPRAKRSGDKSFVAFLPSTFLQQKLASRWQCRAGDRTASFQGYLWRAGYQERGGETQGTKILVGAG